MLPSIDGGGFERPPSTRRERVHPPFGLLPKCSTGNWNLVKCVSGTDTRSLDVFTQSQARYPLGRTQAERNRSTLPFPIRDVNPKAAVRRRSWIPLAVLMSLVYVALLSPSLKQRCPLNLDWWCWASDTASRGGRVRGGLTATLPQPNTGSVPHGRPERPESDITAASRIRTSDSFRLIHMDEYRVYQDLVGSCSHHGSPHTESRA